MTREQLDTFLADYKAICVKHKLYISSCGCCDSPWVSSTYQDIDTPIEQKIQHLIDHLISQFEDLQEQKLEQSK
jgi:hypothetical protein